jgi:hypothetical protein
MRPDDFMNSRMLDEMYGNRQQDDLDQAEGIILACAVGFWLWFFGFCIWTLIAS